MGIFPEGPIRKKLAEIRGATLSTIIRLHTEGYYWLAVIADRWMKIVDWWEARNEVEAREKAKSMLARLKVRRPEAAPYTIFLIETSRYGEEAFL